MLLILWVVIRRCKLFKSFFLRSVCYSVLNLPSIMHFQVIDRATFIMLSLCLLSFASRCLGGCVAGACLDETVSGCDDYVTYQRGEASGWPPVILSAPHGGDLRPPTIPDRDAGCLNSPEAKCVYSHTCGQKDFTRCGVVTEGDFNTYKLTQLLRGNLCELFNGSCPAGIFNNLARIKFDANRDKPEATFNVSEAVCAFLKYKSSIDDAKSVIVRHRQVGLFIDIHGHGHRIQRAELGYLIRKSALDSGRRLVPNTTSIRHLAERLPTVEFDSLLRGNGSFGALLELYGFPAVPSPTHRGPGPGNPYFNGGYLTRQHGSRNGGTIDAIQIESARSHREPPTVDKYAKAIAYTIHRYICQYYSSTVSNEYLSGCSGVHLGVRSGQVSIDVQLYVSLLCIVMLVILQKVFAHRP